MTFPSWKNLAEPFAHILKLTPADEDILQLLQKRIVLRLGWKHGDERKEHRLATPLNPEKLAKASRKKISKRSYERSRPRLVRLGLIALIGNDSRGRKLFAPKWDPRLTNNPAEIFTLAVHCANKGMDQPEYWRSSEGEVGEDPATTIDNLTAAKIEDYGYVAARKEQDKD